MKYYVGTVKVVAFDEAGVVRSTHRIQTAGEPHHIQLEQEKLAVPSSAESRIVQPHSQSTGFKKLILVLVSIHDENNNTCLNADNLVSFRTRGADVVRTVANGDPTSTELFHKSVMRAFAGKLVVSLEIAGAAVLIATSPGLPEAQLNLTVKSF